MTLTRRTFTRLAGAAAGGLLAGARFDALAQGERPVLRFAANASDVFNLDPHFSTSYQDWMIRDMVFNALIRFVPSDSSQYEPDIAVDMPTATGNDDGTQTWTFQLRDDVMVHGTDLVDSYAITASDVIFSFNKASSPETSAFWQDYEGWTFEEVDPRTITITVPYALTEGLFYPKISNYLSGFIVPQKPYEAIGKDGFVLRPVGTGPFRFESHTPQSNVMLLAHDAYFRGAPNLGGVEVRFIADPTSRELALQSRDVDVVHGLPDSRWAQRLDDLDGISVDIIGVGEVMTLYLDTEHEILQDARVREAIIRSISRENHVAAAGEPVSIPVYSIASHDAVPGGLTREEAEKAGVLFGQDFDRARELLAEAGYPDGFEMSLVSSELPIYRKHYEILAEELRQVGVNVELEVVQHAAMHELIRQDRNAVVFYPVFRPNIDFYLTHFLTSDSGVVNFASYTMDDLRDRARRETDPERQVEIWKQAMIQVQADFAAIGLFYNKNVYARLDGVDYGHELVSSIQLYPNITENTTITRQE